MQGFSKSSERIEERGKRLSKKTRSNHHLLAKLAAGWVIILAVIVFGARRLFHVDAENNKHSASQSLAKDVTLEEDMVLLNDAGPACNATLSSFLAAPSPEARNQFVLSPISTAARMARFHSLDSMENIDRRGLSLANMSVLRLPSRKAIETQWTSINGHSLDAVFVEENGEWRLDWEHYSRYSSCPWVLFLAGGETDCGEFRLLARKRLTNEPKKTDDIRLLLYAPRFGHASETGFQSPEFQVKPDSKNGRMLDAAFQLKHSGKPVFDTNLTSLDPEGLIRVRVKVRRIVENKERRFELEDVIACHWYSTDDPGVRIPEQAAEK
jgi:hypothetical protein